MKKISLDTEVIIVGAGLVGNTLAILLAQHNIPCVIIDKKNEANTKITGDDPRALAITYASENILRNADVWQQLQQENIGHFREMYVWDENGNGDIHFDSADICEARLGSIIGQETLEQALRLVAAEQENIKFIQSIPEAFNSDPDKVILELEGGQRIKARLLVGADGARSVIRSLADISFPLHDYQQQAVACIATTEKPHNGTARQRFLTNGPLAFLPMADPFQCGIVWSTTPDEADQLLAMPDTEFNLELARAFANKAGQITTTGPRASFKLQHAQADRYCQPRLVLVGDAAHVIHPLAGQGANQGLLDAAALTDVLSSAHENNRDIGRLSVLRRYERWRKGENLMVMKILQGFKYLFENQIDAVKRTRNIGLDIADAITPLKYSIMRYAMGLSGDLPVSARRTG